MIPIEMHAFKYLEWAKDTPDGAISKFYSRNVNKYNLCLFCQHTYKKKI